MIKYKFLRLKGKKIKSNSGKCEWKIGKKEIYKKDISLCKSGFHCSDKVYQAFSYVQGEVLAEVEVGGKSEVQGDKSVWSEMTINRAWKWEKKDSVALAIYAAKLCIKNYEKIYPEDKRPRKAIEAANKWLADPTEENRLAAESAESAAWYAARSAWSTAWSAESAWSAAWSAARSAESAARSAWSAESATRSTESAARSAWSAKSATRSAAWSAMSAWYAARSNIITKIDKWMTNRISQLEEIK
jgi:hypothetical protein